MGVLPPETLILSRQEWRDDFTAASLDLRDSYRTYAVNEEAGWVAWLTPAEWATVRCGDRNSLRLLQWRLGRGQVYDLTDVADLLADEPNVLQRLAEHAFDADGQRKAVLTYDVWWSMTPRARRLWLASYVKEQQVPCLSPALPPDFWDEADASCGPAVRRLVGTFAERSGPNCFSTVLAGVTRSLDAALSVAGLWLFGEPFLRGVTAKGFAPKPMPHDVDSIPAGAVLLWKNAGGDVIHAALTLGRGMALNKDSQGWSSPRQVRTVQDLLQDWGQRGVPSLLARQPQA